MAQVTDPEIRQVVKSVLAESSEAGSLVLDEFMIGEAGRIDLLHVSSGLAGYELKGDLDSLYRLPRQMDVYSGVFSLCTLVVTQKHLSRARDLLRPGWGLAVVRRDADDLLEYRQVRRARELRSVKTRALVTLLWRDEMLRALDILDAADGIRSKPRERLEERLIAQTDLAQLNQIVVEAITARQGWRDVQVPRAHGARFQRASVSSGFLARRLRSQRPRSAGRPG